MASFFTPRRKAMGSDAMPTLKGVWLSNLEVK